MTAKKIAEKINQYGRNKIKECGGALLDKLTEELPGKASEWSVMVDDNNDISVYSYLIPITLRVNLRRALAAVVLHPVVRILKIRRIQ